MSDNYVDLPVLGSTGGGGGSGTVTSVGLSLPVEFTVSNSPVTTTGTLTGVWALESANTYFAGPASGAPGTPGFRAPSSADIPTLSYVNTVGLIDSQAKSANGLVVSGNAIYAQTADATHVGLASTGTQTFAGNKTFSGTSTFSQQIVLNGSVTYTPTIDASTGSNYDVASHSTDYLQFTSNALVSIGSINNQSISSGHNLLLTNKTGRAISLVNKFSGTPVTSAPILTGAAADIVLPSSGGAVLIYDAPSTAWFVSSGIITQQLANSLMVSGTLPIANGGTGRVTASSAFDALSPMTALGDTIYGAGVGTATRLAGNTTATKNFLTQTGTGAVSAAPAWGTIASGDVPPINLASNANGGVTGILPSTAVSPINLSSTSNGGVTGTINLASNGSGGVTGILPSTAVGPINLASNANGGVTGILASTAVGATNLAISGNGGVTGVLPVANGGTGLAVPSSAFTMIITAPTTSPTKGTIVFDKAYYNIMPGSVLHVHYSFKQSAGGNAGTGQYNFSLPAGLSVNTNTLPTASDGSVVIGYGVASNTATGIDTTSSPLIVVLRSSTAVVLYRQPDTAGAQQSNYNSAIDNTTFPLSGTNVVYNFDYMVPIN